MDIKVINHWLFDAIVSAITVDPEWATTLQISPKDIQIFQRNPDVLDDLFSVPFLFVDPAIRTYSEWSQLLTGDAAKLSSFVNPEAPKTVRPDITNSIVHANRHYLKHLCTVCFSDPIVSATLNLPPDVIELLGKADYRQLANAQGFTTPLFRWRYRSDQFWVAAKRGKLDRQMVAHHLMQHSKYRLHNLPATSSVVQHTHAETAYTLAGELIMQGMRGSVLSPLFPQMRPAKIRELTRRLTGGSTRSGKFPTATDWYFANERRRLHSTFYLWLYRHAVLTGLRHIEAIVAAYSLYQLTLKDDLIDIDRMPKLITTVQSGSGEIYAAPCRICGTGYILSNQAGKNELRSTFRCPVCAAKQGRQPKRLLATLAETEADADVNEI
jgi:hypothetical protein